VIRSLDAALGVGIGFRFEIADWIFANLSEFDALEVTIDHYINGTSAQKATILELATQIPLVAHGVGLSLGTDMLPDTHYLEEVATAIALLEMPWYSEHLAFTKVPGVDLAQLLPLARNGVVAERVIRNIRYLQQHISVPFLIENITYYFDYPDSEFTEVEFMDLICKQTGAFLLLDVENVYLNSRNHEYCAESFIRSLSPGSVKAVHLAGGTTLDDVLVDTHDHPVPDEALALLRCLLERQRPDTIILERDERTDQVDEILRDVHRIREQVCSFQKRVD
jgi:uncharacterized protein (UPF0276 family)